jgi:hypothetical protein
MPNHVVFDDEMMTDASGEGVKVVTKIVSPVASLEARGHARREWR